MVSSPSGPSELRWRKASRSAQGTDSCVELASAGRIIAVRDSKDPDGPRLVFSRSALRRLAAEVGRLDP
jgi:hypothetical protein